MCRPHIISRTTTEKGREVSTTADLSASMLPANSSPPVTRATAAPQNTRSHLGPSSSASPPLDDRVDSTTVPESAEVTKKTKLTSTATLITTRLAG